MDLRLWGWKVVTRAADFIAHTSHRGSSCPKKELAELPVCPVQDGVVVLPLAWGLFAPFLVFIFIFATGLGYTIRSC